MPSPRVIDDIPGDKSVSHRGIIIGSMAQGTSRFEGFLCSDDCLHTLAIFNQLGVPIHRDGTSVTITGVGPRGWKSPNAPLNVGNSGTAIRLIAGALSGSGVTATLTGDASIQSRPMGRIVTPLTAMGATIHMDWDTPPLTVVGCPHLHPNTRYVMPIASAQVKSAILLAACASSVPVQVYEPIPCRDHTERLLTHFGATIHNDNGTISMDDAALVAPSGVIPIPRDISSALFFICHALMTNTPTIFKGIGLNTSRSGALEVLKMMGAHIVIHETDTAYEPMGDIHVMSSPHRTNIDIPLSLIPNVIDELPILSVLALSQSGRLRIRGARELRVKESDRIAGIARLIRWLGGRCDEVADGVDVWGPIAPPASPLFDATFDHRLAMSAAIASSVLGVSCQVTGEDSILTSFPNFHALLASVS